MSFLSGSCIIHAQAPGTEGQGGLISNTQPHDALNREHRNRYRMLWQLHQPVIATKQENPVHCLYFVDEEYLVTALVPSETACLASSPGRIKRTLRTGQTGCEKRNEKNVRGLDLPRRDGGLLGVCGKLGGLSGDALEDVCED